MEMNAERKTGVDANTRANILALTSIIIFVAWLIAAFILRNKQIEDTLYMIYIGWFCWIIAFLCGVMSLKVIKNIKGFLWARLLAWIICTLSVICIFGFTHMLVERFLLDKEYCEANLKVLSASIRAYCAKHNGEFPEPAKWGDVIISEPDNKFESKDYNPNFFGTFCVERFRCPAVTEGKSSYAFNKNLAGKHISEVDPNVVVLFETNTIGWNQNGGPELICPDRHKAIFEENGSYVALLGKDKPVIKFVPQSEAKNLRWNP